MSLEQYKDASRKELWDILQIQMQVLQAETAKVAELEKELKETREICDAVAHVGVDFGYGVYVLEDSVIHRARLILEALKEQVK